MNDDRTIQQILSNFKIEIEKELSSYLNKKTKEAYRVSKQCGEMVSYISDITMRGGKRIRAALLYYSYLAHGGKNKKVALNAAMSLELAQTYLLIHDDIIDRDNYRRGGRTIHKIYESIAKERFRKSIDPSHYGRSVAILAGDYASVLSTEILFELKLDSKLAYRALKELNYMYYLEYFGQLLDINSELIKDIKQSDIIQIHGLKTSPYTFSAPLKIGAILADTPEREVRQLEKYTIPLGVAFQMQDDVLGMFGNEQKLGKSVVSDLREGKKTILILNALKKANRHQKSVILRSLGNPKVTAEDLEEVKKIIIETGALNKSNELAKKFVDKAIRGIENLRLDAEWRNFLIQIANLMINRES